jgi:phosphate acyltransferase
VTTARAEAAELPVALDAMGGDFGASVNVEGALAAVREDGARVVLVGDESLLKRELEKAGASPFLSSGKLSLRHAPEAVEMDEKPAAAVRKKKSSSMRVACDLVKAGEASGALSAGNSGAMMAIALFVFGRIDGVQRPAIATMFPSQASIGFSLLVDAGANTDCTSEHLLQWGILGATYLKHARGLEALPTIGVVSNGEEDTKGTDLTRGALALLRRTDLPVHGYVEGRDVTSAIAPVIVTDGFTGNVMLKTGEGVLKFVLALIKQGYLDGRPLEKLGGMLSRPMFERLRKKIDPREFGAAPLLGLAAPAFIAHGASDAYAIRRGIAAVREHAAHDVTHHLAAAIAKWRPLLDAPRADPEKLDKQRDAAG